ncbi:hypothetical protein BZG36_03842 [Bifiguratus adelaidae]|uniref:Type 1 phosphatases regulator n=1 Tax=Bifiguratus adelaidae TaxID=1938954 RepID=A0A261XW86_9FUNG|nr:hypothetical protein BZG36_03842 [Bifiguratus adelaidae]
MAGNATRVRQFGRPAEYASRTMTIHPEEIGEEGNTSDSHEHGILRLTGERTLRPRQIQWAENVVDNEGMGKKKSKICCIYHKSHAIGESSDESTCSSSDSESESGSDKDAARGRDKGKRRRKRDPRQVSPNAYERQPKYTPKNKPTVAQPPKA